MTKNARVLVIEDEWLIADDYDRVLRKAGHAVAGPVSNVKAAMRLIDDGGIDAAVLDITLGSGKSFPVAERLKAEGVPFAFLTGYSDAEIPHELKSVPLLSKPTTPAKLLVVVSELLASR